MFSPYMPASCAKPVQAIFSSGKLNTEFTQRPSEAALSNLLLIKGRPFLCSPVRTTSGFSVSQSFCCLRREVVFSCFGGNVLGLRHKAAPGYIMGRRQYAWESITKAGNKGVFTPEPCLVSGALWNLWPTCPHNDKFICLKSFFLSLHCCQLLL